MKTRQGEAALAKLSLFSGVAAEAIASLPNAKTIYEVPLTLEDTGIADVIAKRLGLKAKKPDLKRWRAVVEMATGNHKNQSKSALWPSIWTTPTPTCQCLKR